MNLIDLSHQRLNNRRVGPEAGVTTWDIARWLAVGLIFVGLGLAYSQNQNLILNLQFEMEEFEGDNAQLREQNNSLRAEYRLLTSPERIEKQCRELGLVSANHSEIIIVQAQASLPPEDNLVATLRSSAALHE